MKPAMGSPSGQRDATAQCGLFWNTPARAAWALDRVRRLLVVGWAGLFSLGGGARGGEPILSLATDMAAFAIDRAGSLVSISRKDNGRNYLAVDQPAPVLSIRAAGRISAPSAAAWDPTTRRLSLEYGAAGVRVVLSAAAQPAYLTLALVEIQPADSVELVVWGPYPTRIKETIGETVGVVRDGEFAIGIQALNVKTLGGYPVSESDAEAESSADDEGLYPELPLELRKGQHYRGDTARRTEFGSVLQAYCRSRTREQVVPNWGHPKYCVPAFSDGGVMGSRIALFACPSAQVLSCISAIEVAEGLPHPMIDGVWGKISPGATASYLIVDFSEANVERAIEMTRRAGLRYLYHSSPFETWGHFKLKPSLFPSGWEGLRACVEKARSSGVRVGVHMLSNFITPNDAYVTPRPDPRLAVIGSSELAAAVDASQKEVPVLAAEYFRSPSTLSTVRIGNELIRFGSLSTNAPWRLLDCERGAWGTSPSAHAPGSAVSRLLDHPYKVFHSDADLSQEIARNLAALFNQTGLLQTSFDGLEGNWSTGYGKYGCALFTQAWFDALQPALRGQVINDASLPGHFNWHINTRMNWGEPWYGGFRESQTLYRFKNQVYFERNLLPHMLGWFALRPDTSLEDAEWLLARAAGFNAGFALATSLASTAQLEADPGSAEAARRFGATPAILEIIRHWETARMAGAFPPALRSALRDNAREFHLQPVSAGSWELQEVHLARLTHDAGQASETESAFTGPRRDQSCHWIIRASGKEPIRDLRIGVNAQTVVELTDQALPPGGSLRYSGGSEAVLADAKWLEVGRVQVDPEAVRAAGQCVMKIRCAPQPGASLRVEMRVLDPGTRISK